MLTAITLSIGILTSPGEFSQPRSIAPIEIEPRIERSIDNRIESSTDERIDRIRIANRDQGRSTRAIRIRERIDEAQASIRTIRSIRRIEGWRQDIALIQRGRIS